MVNLVNDTMILFEDKKMDPAKKGGAQWHGGPGSKEYQKSIISKAWNNRFMAS